MQCIGKRSFKSTHASANILFISHPFVACPFLVGPINSLSDTFRGSQAKVRRRITKKSAPSALVVRLLQSPWTQADDCFSFGYCVWKQLPHFPDAAQFPTKGTPPNIHNKAVKHQGPEPQMPAILTRLFGNLKPMWWPMFLKARLPVQCSAAM